MKNSKQTKEAKRRIVAKGKVTGASTRTIARAAGTSERHVQRIAAEPETQFLITKALAPHREELESLAGKAIQAVDKSLVALKGDEEDHIIRLRGVERYKDLLDLAQGKIAEQQVEERPMVTWEEFLVLYRRYQEKNGPSHRPDETPA